MPEPNTTSTKPTEPAKPEPATLKQLKEAFPKSTADWREQILEEGNTLAEAKDAWIAEQDRILAEKEAELEAANKATAGKKRGVEPVEDAKASASGSGEESVGAIERWDAAVAEHVKAGKTRAKAIAAVAKADPDLHAEYIEEFNAAHAPAGRPRNRRSA